MYMNINTIRSYVYAPILAAVLLLSGCASSSLPALQGREEPVDLPRFMGDWYVIAFIPIAVPGMSEVNAHNAIESYKLDSDGSIATTYTYRDKAFDGKPVKRDLRATVANPPVNSEWKMKFKWFLPAGNYLITYVDEEYQRTIIAVPDRKWVWLLARQPTMPDAEYDEMEKRIRDAGFDMSKFRKVPQQWP